MQSHQPPGPAEAASSCPKAVHPHIATAHPHHLRSGPGAAAEIAKAALGTGETAQKVGEAAVSVVSAVTGVPISTPADAERAVATYALHADRGRYRLGNVALRIP